MSSVPTGQRGQPSPPAGPDGQDGLAGTGRADPPRWQAAAARYGPAVLAAAVMAALGVWGLARDSSMGNDEVATRWAALLSLHQLAHLLRHVDAVHGLYYLVMHGWMAAGTSPAVIRIPSVIAMVVAVALTVIIGRRLTGSGWAGLFAGLIVALTPAISYYAQTARSYALVFACVLGSTLALLHALAGEAGAQAQQGERAGGTRFPAGRWLVYAVL
ncbi:MAG TPA: glycosyltransferase family 39 protein, partial [Streptosporangiaceae bacterium]